MKPCRFEALYGPHKGLQGSERAARQVSKLIGHAITKENRG